MIWKLTENKEWATLEKQFSWVADMKNVEQYPKYHAEGNVGIHTEMVLNELVRNSAYQQLDKQTQEILWASALLHDVEKRSTSAVEVDGVISSKGHAKKGEFTTRTILFRDIPTPFYIREQIASLVRFHGLPLWLFEKSNPVKKVHEISLRLNTKLLKILSEADAKGRICDDYESLHQSLELFEMFCKEQDCWGKARSFQTENARYVYFNTPNGYVNYIPHDNFKCEAILLSGLPGMGKDFFIQSLDKDIPVVSLDAIRRKNKISPTDRTGNGRVIQEAKENARSYLRKGQDFVWNATNISRQLRSQLVSLFTEYGAKVKIVYIEKPYEIWRKQNNEREYALPTNVLDNMLAKLEIPQLTEAHEIEYVVY